MTNKKNLDIRTKLGRSTSLNGTLKFGHSLQISGRYEGKIESTGFLYVDENAEVVAEIQVGSVLVSGTVRGNIEAAVEVELLETAKIFGNIRTGRLKIADGVVFEGKCEMLKNPDAIDIFSAGASQLKESLENF